MTFAAGRSPSSGKPGFRAVVRACWRPPTVRIGVLLSALHFAFMAFLTVYHTVVGTQVPDNATPAQVWAAFPPIEQKALIASGVVFAIGIVLLGLGLRRGLRGGTDRG